MLTLYSGQGAQWAEMGSDLLPLYLVFAQSMLNAEEEFLRLGADWRLLEELGKAKPDSSVHQVWLSLDCVKKP